MQDTLTQQFDIEIPEDMPEGPALLRLSDAQSSYAWERTRAPLKSRIVDLPHLLKLVQEEERNDDIIIELFISKVGMISDGQELPALPLTTFSAMSSRKRLGGRGLTRGTTFSRQKIRMDYPIAGSATMILNIDRDAP